ncbi:MAG: hypothetical protein M3014_02300, partial [Chloroflexota bacterium]|nr:hypothetical protein [Chloroflexota bacterium]
MPAAERAAKIAKQASNRSLLEYEPCDMPLGRYAYATLRDLFTGKLDVTPTEQHGTYRVISQGYVGHVTLPGLLHLHIRPRAGAGSLLHMLSAEPGLAQIFDPLTTLGSDTRISTFI